jgi:hypothetical protein
MMRAAFKVRSIRTGTNAAAAVSRKNVRHGRVTVFSRL